MLTKYTGPTGVVQALSDKPNESDGLSANQLKQKFDETPDALASYLNTTLTDEVDTEIALKADQATTYTKTEVDNQLALKADQATTYTKTEIDGFTVKLTGPQTVAGVKTFSDAPIVPTPTGGTEAANKAYVDAFIGGAVPDGSITNAKLATDVKVGSLALLNTTVKTDVVSAVNEVEGESSTHIADLANPHVVTKAQLGLDNVTNDAQLRADQLETTITDDDTKVPSSGAVVDYVALNAGGAWKVLYNGALASPQTDVDVTGYKHIRWKYFVPRDNVNTTTVNMKVNNDASNLYLNAASSPDTSFATQWNIGSSNLSNDITFHGYLTNTLATSTKTGYFERYNNQASSLPANGNLTAPVTSTLAWCNTTNLITQLNFLLTASPTGANLIVEGVEA